MSKTRLLLSALGLSGLLISGAPAFAQAPLFAVPDMPTKQLQERALELARDAVRLAQVGRTDEAESLARLGVQLSRKSYQSYTVLGGVYLQNNKTTEALDALTHAAELAPDNARVQFNLALVYQRQKDYPKVVSTLKRGLELDPKAGDEYFNLGNAYVLLDRRADALAAFEQAVALKSTFWEAINNIGLLNYENGNIAEAKDRWQQASSINARAAEPRLALGVALYASGEQEKGLTLGEEAFAIDKHYAELDYLKENLWGAKLLADTAKLLGTPRIKAALERLPDPVDESDATVSTTP